jgi:hypothetical protein
MSGRNLFAEEAPPSEGRNLFADTTPAQGFEQRIQTQMPAARERQQQRPGSGYGPLGQATEAVEIPILSPLMRRAEAGISAAIGRGEGGDFSTRYASEASRLEANRRAFQEARPAESVAGEIAGGLATLPIFPTLAAPRVAAAVQPALNVASRYVPQAVSDAASAAARYVPGFISRPTQAVGRAAVPVGLAAAESGLYGAAEEAAKLVPGESLGDVAERAKEGGEFGALLGGGLRAGLGALGAGAGAIRNYINPQLEIAQRAQTTGLGKGQMTLNEFETAAARAIPDPTGVNPILDLPLSIADLPGGRRMVEDALGRIGQKDTPTARQLQEFFQNRQAEATNTTRQNIDKIFGRSIEPSALMREANDVARTANAPMYRAAYSQPMAQHVWNDELAQNLMTPWGQKAAQEAIDGLTSRSQTPGGFTNPFVRQNGQLVFSGQGQVPLEFWDRFRRSLNDQAQEAFSSNARTRGGDIDYARKQLQNYLAASFIPYREAVSGAGKYLRADNAFTAGEEFFREASKGKQADTRYVGNQMYQFANKFSPEEKNMFRTGLAAYIRTNPDDAAKVFASRDASILNQYRAILGDNTFNNIQSTMLVHGVSRNIRDIVARESPVQRGVEKIAGYGGIGSVLYALANGITVSPGHAIAAAGVSGAGFLSNVMGNARARQIVRLAMSDNPEDAARLADMARRQPAVARMIEEINSGLSRIVMSQDDQGAPPPRRAGGRVGRASGGRLMRNDHAARAAALIKAAEAAKKAHNATTEGILEQPDEAVAKALSIANKAI